MVIGAGKFQLPAIIKAKEMGFKVLATDLDPNAPGFRSADFHRAVDIKDAEANLTLAKEFAIDGVISVVSELSVRTVSYVAQQLGLPGLNYDAAVATTDKAVMRAKFREVGLPTPKFIKVRTEQEAVKAILELALPVVMKPTDNSGSRGVTRIDKLSDVEFSFPLAKQNSHSGDIIIEQYLEGTEMTVEALSYNNRHQVLAMSSKQRIPFPYCVSIDLTYPPPFPKETLDKVRKLVISGLDALGINMGASHTEVMLTPQGPFPVETAARGGGFLIFSDIIPFISGVDILKQCIKMAMGEKVDIRPKYAKAAVLRFFNLPPGKLVGVNGLEEARALEGVHVVELAVNPGDIVKPIVSDGTRHGQMVTLGDTRELAVRRADQVEKTVRFEIIQ